MFYLCRAIERVGLKDEAQVLLPAISNRMNKQPFTEQCKFIRFWKVLMQLDLSNHDLLMWVESLIPWCYYSWGSSSRIDWSTWCVPGQRQVAVCAHAWPSVRYAWSCNDWQQPRHETKSGLFCRKALQRAERSGWASYEEYSGRLDRQFGTLALQSQKSDTKGPQGCHCGKRCGVFPHRLCTLA